MGNYTRFDNGNLVIPVAQFAALVEAVPGLLKRYHVTNESVAVIVEGNRERPEGSILNRIGLAEQWAVAAVQALFEERFNPLVSMPWYVGVGTVKADPDNYGSPTIEGIAFSFGETKHFDFSMGSGLAPFMQEDSYMQVSDDSAMWRFVAHDGKLYIVTPTWDVTKGNEY